MNKNDFWDWFVIGLTIVVLIIFVIVVEVITK
jgi:hypothetical protein